MFAHLSWPVYNFFSMRIWLIFFILMSFSVLVHADVEKLIFSHYTNSYNTQKPYKTLSELNLSVSLEQAYDIQHKLVQNILTKQPKRGFKVALTTSESQKQYNISEPILGVLVSDQVYDNFSIISKRSFTDLQFEIEIGFVLNHDITKPIHSLYLLKQYIKSVHSVIEIVDFRFGKKKSVQIGDLIISNVLSSSYLLGPELSLQPINQLPIVATYSGKVVSSYEHVINLDDYLMSLMWAINKAIGQGWRVSKDDLIITGVLGEMFPGKKGRYIIDYGHLTSIMFDVR